MSSFLLALDELYNEYRFNYYPKHVTDAPEFSEDKAQNSADIALKLLFIGVGSCKRYSINRGYCQ